MPNPRFFIIAHTRPTPTEVLDAIHERHGEVLHAVLVEAFPCEPSANGAVEIALRETEVP